MREQELGKELEQVYNEAPEGTKMVHIHLFGIKYGEEIIERGLSPKEIIIYSNIKKSFQTELRTGIKLAQYVNLK